MDDRKHVAVFDWVMHNRKHVALFSLVKANYVVQSSKYYIIKPQGTASLTFSALKHIKGTKQFCRAHFA